MPRRRETSSPSRVHGSVEDVVNAALEADTDVFHDMSGSGHETLFEEFEGLPEMQEGAFKRPLIAWSEEDEDKLKNIVWRYNERNWKKVAEHFPDRTYIQCMHHWKRVLNPRLGKYTYL